MRTRFAVVALATLLLPAAGSAATFDIDPAHSSAGFRIRHLVSRVSGSFTKLAGTISLDEKQLAQSEVKATIDAASIATQNEKRDNHLKGPDFFDAAKYPTITFASKKVTRAGKNRFRVLGDLTMHGVTKPVTLDVRYGGQAVDPWGGRRAGFTATTVLNRREFGVSWNQALDKGGAVLGDDVEVTLEIEAVQKK